MKLLTVLFIIGVQSLLSEAQEVDWPVCDPNIVSWHPHPFACTRYVLCFHGNPIERLCAPNLHFSAEMLHCTFPQLALCDINYACPAEDDKNYPVFLPDPEDCSAYFVCFEGSPIRRECAPNLWFDVVYNWCNVGDDVTCDSRVPNHPRDSTLAPTTTEPTTTTTETTTTTTTTTTPTTTTPTTTTTTTTTTQNPNTYDCPLSSEPSNHPHSLECHKYFVCINGIAFLRECSPGLIFDIISRNCDDAELATCISGANNNPDHVPQEIVPGRFDCPLSRDTLWFPHEVNCNRYYRCDWGIAYLQVCQPHQSYDVYRQECVNSSDAVCFNDL